ncbi:ABC transporter permease subunit [Microbacterium sp. EYE_5]|uniref:ABC transporter permease n=1 Tax=unclassified Microbacterium TaxID=2609290 RepID=UPI002004BB23|nr:MULTISPECIES: ABC transporter permease subunit [unclassified Microbacterium]MCK6080082.1 ABC transporter permease subunit [Microbacterium sp. EYE_382]MCK6085353.1 ABC transporter permease subunit [Microbacterium sp. EYE_384]MCK6122422.1 ABC transporter permease subunit [Microbacterium sp. EYE_80]MCK6126116.1 ABC transporter permease subunit [Microbacterium sp. EYE_79]MCK6141037.1 ABC transporter permease subunit [Microbacterium sp. EYE_39]
MTTTQRISRIAAPVATGILLLLLWQVLSGVKIGRLSLIPAPADVAETAVRIAAVVGEDALVTGGNTLVGLVLGTLLGVVLAALAAWLRPADGMLAPLVAAIAVVPIVALTPLLNTMFGASAQSGRQIVAAIAAFVPVFVNVLRGLRQSRPVQRDLFLAYAATGGQQFRKLTLPVAVPYLVTGVRIASSVAVISALVAEYFGGPTDGLGTAIASYAKTGNAAVAWTYVGAAVAVGLIFFLVTVLLERAVTRRRPV